MIKEKTVVYALLKFNNFGRKKLAKMFQLVLLAGHFVMFD